MRSNSEPAGETGRQAAPAPVDRALLEKWALAYLERYASSAENLRRVLQRRVWRRARGDGAADGAGMARGMARRCARRVR